MTLNKSVQKEPLFPGIAIVKRVSLSIVFLGSAVFLSVGSSRQFQSGNSIETLPVV